MKRQILAWPLALLLALPASAQNLPQPAARPEPRTSNNGSTDSGDEIRKLIAGDKYPLTLKLKDIDIGWRRMSISAALESSTSTRTAPAPEVFSLDDFAATLLSYFGGEQGDYLTRGVTVKEGGDSFLVAYRVRLDRKAVKTFEDSYPKDGPPPTFAQVSRVIEMFVQERPLDLALLNLSMVGRFAEIRPFRFQDQMALLNTRLKGEFTEAMNTSSLSNLRQLGRALRAYIADKNEVLPPLQNDTAARTALMPYAKSETLFSYPGQSKHPYATNPVLSERKLAHFEKYQSMLVVFYEAAPASDGTRGVVFLNGHAKRIRESEWPQLKKVSKIS